ncbi:MAG: type II toxin-antitoxin system VapC family toxin [Phycisphaeraceae bacterium]|nr:type II toxin-antitoxin system VapC family toxin [Phycisphaeraceae bacterium]
MVIAAGQDSAVLDSSVLIDFSRGHEAAVCCIETGPPSRFVVHPVSAAELLKGSKSRAELRALDELLDRFDRIRCQPQDFDHCVALVRRFSLSHGVGWPDCLIAATAIRLGLPIVTLNDKHFKVFKGLKVRRPY